MKKKKKAKVSVYGPDGSYMSQCQGDRADVLVFTGRASLMPDGSIQIKHTRQDRKKIMQDIINHAGRRCYICGTEIPADEKGTIDHIVPKTHSKYADVYSNMACCCRRCNEDKADMLPTEYIDYICSTREMHAYITDEQFMSLKTKLTLHQRSFYESLRKTKRNGITAR